jgi:hypothetical protein
MATIARDPDVLRVGLPPGGCPSWDDSYVAWAKEFVRQWEVCWLLQEQPEWEGFDLASAFKRCPRNLSLRVESCPINPWRLTGHLFKWLNGEIKYPLGINYQHRLRFVSIQFHYRPATLIAEAESYVNRLMAEALEPAS